MSYSFLVEKFGWKEDLWDFLFLGKKGFNMAVNKKDKATTVSAASRTITADGVRIENGMFMDDEGNISERVAEFLLNPSHTFKVTIKFELPDEEESVE